MTRTSPGRLLLGSYPYVGPVIARYADVDSFRHINNVAMAQYFEETRISMLRTLLGFERLDRIDGRILLARVSIDYLREGSYPGSFDVGAAIVDVGRTSTTVGLGLFTEEGTCIAVSEAVLVRLDAAGPSPWTADERRILEDPVWQLQRQP